MKFVSLNGAFVGLNNFLEHFGPSEMQREAFAEQIYNCLLKWSQPVTRATLNECRRVDIPKNVQYFLIKRYNLVSKQMFENFFDWHELIVNGWLRESSYENRQTAIELLHVIHREIANNCLMDRDDIKQCKILKYLSENFKGILESNESEPYEIRFAINGIGLMAAPCKKWFGSADEPMQLVMQRTVYAINSLNHNDPKHLEHFPYYGEALSRFLELNNRLADTLLNILENITMCVIRNFHSLLKVHHDMTIKTLMRTFCNLSQLGGSVIDDFLKRVVYDGVIWTCSHTPTFDDENNKTNSDTDRTDRITYASYLPLWNGFLAECRDWSHDGITGKIYDRMMRTLLTILVNLWNFW